MRGSCPTCGQPTGPPEPDSPILTVAEIATRAKRSEKFVRSAMRKGSLPASQRNEHGPWRAHVDDVDAWARGESPKRGRKRSA